MRPAPHQARSQVLRLLWHTLDMTMNEAPPNRFCTACGTALEPGRAFCSECGQRVDVAPPIPAPVVVSVTAPSSAPVISSSPAVRSPNRALWITTGLFIAAVLVGGLAWMFRDRLFPSPPPAAGTVILADPVEAFDEPSSRPPEQVAYVHFLDEVHNRLKGRLSVGSPTITPGRIEISLTRDGRRETLVVIEKENDGRAATVLVGPKDAGAIRSYTLTRNGQGWQITGFQDLDG